MDFEFEVRLLNADFYAHYPREKYPEMENKTNRPYSCLVFELPYLRDYFVCIPFRTHLNAKNGFCYRFRHSQRAQSHRSGLDYQKLAIVSGSFLGEIAVVDKDEFNEMRQNIAKIQRESGDFIEKYVQHINGTHILHPREFDRRYRFATLPYFHLELGLTP